MENVKSRRAFFAAPIFDDPHKTRIAFLLNFITIAYFIIASSVTLLGVAAGQGQQGTWREVLLRLGPLLVILVASQSLMRRGYINAASATFGVLLWLNQTFGIYVTGGAQSYALFNYVLSIMVFGLLLGRNYAIGSGIVSFIASVAFFILGSRGMLPETISEQTPITSLLTFLVFVFLSTALLYLYLRLFNQALQELSEANAALEEAGAQLNQRVVDATQNLSLAAEVGRRLSLVQDIGSMLDDAVNVIRESFDLYYTQIYLADPTSRSLVLRAGTGDVGQTLLQRNHRLPLDLSSLNGIAATERRTIVVENTETSLIHRPNTLLPDTRSEMAVPLVVGEHVVGVLDMQSAQAGALSEENRTAFEALAGQLAIAISNANLFEDVEQARAAVEAQARRLTSEGWQNYLNAIDRGEYIGYSYDREKIIPLTEAPSEELTENVLVAPLELLGSSIGKFKIERDREWTEDDNAIASAVARQVAQQVENLRLLAQAEQYQTEAQQALRRLTREGWEGYTETLIQEAGFVYQADQVKPLSSDLDGSDDMYKYEIKVRNEPVGIFEVAGASDLSEDEAELVAIVSDRLSAHIENLRLTNQTQSALNETEKLYEASAALNAAETYTEILDVVKSHILLRDAQNISLNFFNRPWKRGEEPEWIDVLARWSILPETAVFDRYSLSAFPSAEQLLQADASTLIEDVKSDPRLDENARKLYADQFGAKSTIFVPLVVGGQWVGYINGIFQQAKSFPDADVRQFMTLAGQAAVAINNIRQLIVTQERAKREQALGQITRAVRSSTDLSIVMRTAVRELGEILGRKTAIRMNIAEKDMSDSPTETSQGGGAE